MIGTVQEFGQTQKGSPKVKIMGAWYFAGKTDVSYMKVGQKIEFNTSRFGDKGQFQGIDNWRAVEEGNGVHAQVPIPHQPAQQPAREPVSTPIESIPVERLAAISNWVREIIAKDKIQEPQDLVKWVWWANKALSLPPLAPESTADPEFNDKIPF